MTAPTDTARILRYEVTVDDQWHTLTLPGPIVHVATRHTTTVELWVSSDGMSTYQLDLCVYGTGQPFPPGEHLQHRGTAITPNGLFVWHLMQRGPQRTVNEPNPAQGGSGR